MRSGRQRFGQEAPKQKLDSRDERSRGPRRGRERSSAPGTSSTDRGEWGVGGAWAAACAKEAQAARARLGGPRSSLSSSPRVMARPARRTSRRQTGREREGVEVLNDNQEGFRVRAYGIKVSPSPDPDLDRGGGGGGRWRWGLTGPQPFGKCFEPAFSPAIPSPSGVPPEFWRSASGGGFRGGGPLSSASRASGA